MDLSLHPDARCTLELDGATVALSAEELSALRECMLDFGRSPQAALPKALFRQLFEAGILSPVELRPGAESAYWAAALPQLALSSYLRINCAFSDSRGDADAVEPPIGMYLDSDFARAAADLSRDLRGAIRRAAEACAVGRVPFPRRKALALTQAIAEQWLEARPETARWIRCARRADGDLDFEIPDLHGLARSTPALPFAVLTISKADHIRGPSRQVTIPIEALPALARVMDALRTGQVDAGLTDALSQGFVRSVLGAIEGVGGFVSCDSVPPVYASAASAETAIAVTHMGHASLVVDGGGRRILFDPWLFAWDVANERQPLTSAQLGRVDAIFFTHHHTDHLNPDSLLLLPHDATVFVPCETGAPFEPKTAAFLRLLGFQDVRELRHGDSFTVGDHLAVEALPFFGEGQDRLGFGANCYLISCQGKNVLIHADASPDSSGRSIVSTGVVHDIVERHGAVDAIFGTWWQERTFLCCLSPFSIFHPATRPSQWMDDTDKCDCQTGFLHELVGSGGAKLLILYAENGSECFLPTERMSSYIPALSLLWNDRAAVAQSVKAATAARVVTAHPYLRVILELTDGLPWVDQSDVGPSRQQSLERWPVATGRHG